MAANIHTLGFNFPELIIEGLIRDGILEMQTDPTLLQNIFLQLTRAYNTQKYGQAEITKIQTLLGNTPIPVVYSYSAVDAKVPCFSIMLESDNEEARYDHLNDYYGTQDDDITDSAALLALIRVPNLIPTSYDATSGRVTVDDSVDLTTIYLGTIYYDGSGNQFPVLSGINTLPGQKSFFIPKNQTPNIGSPGSIRSSLNYTEHEIHGVTMAVKLVLGVHTKDVLLTKYLYILLKYFLMSRKRDMIQRGLYLSMYSGSDFTRNIEYQGDQIYTRFLSLTGKVDDTWVDEAVQQIDDYIIDPVPEDVEQID